ncbi:hypothetical protein DH86_00002956, partial [Scytalidium sp. 3C]
RQKGRSHGKSTIHDDFNNKPLDLRLRQHATMATELTVQSERAFQKQPHIFLNSKSKTKSTRVGKGGRRWYKDVGLGFRTPKTAIEGTYIGMWIFFFWGPGSSERAGGLEFGTLDFDRLKAWEMALGKDGWSANADF